MRQKVLGTDLPMCARRGPRAVRLVRPVAFLSAATFILCYVSPFRLHLLVGVYYLLLI